LVAKEYELFLVYFKKKYNLTFLFNPPGDFLPPFNAEWLKWQRLFYNRTLIQITQVSTDKPWNSLLPLFLDDFEFSKKKKFLKGLLLNSLSKPESSHLRVFYLWLLRSVDMSLSSTPA